MDKLDGLKKKYPTVKFKYEPMEGCKRCDGTGERHIKKLDHTTFCICTMVSHDICDVVATELSRVAKRLKKERA